MAKKKKSKARQRFERQRRKLAMTRESGAESIQVPSGGAKGRGFPEFFRSYLELKSKEHISEVESEGEYREMLNRYSLIASMAWNISLQSETYETALEKVRTISLGDMELAPRSATKYMIVQALRLKYSLPADADSSIEAAEGVMTPDEFSSMNEHVYLASPGLSDDSEINLPPVASAKVAEAIELVHYGNENDIADLVNRATANQPHIGRFIKSLPQLGVDEEKAELLWEVLLVCYYACDGDKLPIILYETDIIGAVEKIEQMMSRLNDETDQDAWHLLVTSHPEPELLHYAMGQLQENGINSETALESQNQHIVTTALVMVQAFHDARIKAAGI
jgi:hypothetical protein